ncbi:MAG: ATP-dependent Clp protease ATP-binding subunit [Planctomycetes bacterium]|nr:ATP-dependent Clp protease ATP-binding subunit [Planctomycetota bacterium]
MNTSKSRSVYRYFEPADAFVQILVCDGSALDVQAGGGLNRQSYRRLVVQTCCPEFRQDFRARLEKLMPEDPLLAEDLLYQLCVEVNPSLDIHTVRLRGESRAEEGREAQAAEKRGGAGDESDFHVRLRRRVHDLERRLLRQVIGQDPAVRTVVKALEKCAAGLAAPNRPLSTFLFLGRTGVGKTELARALAGEVFSDGKAKGLVRIDCSEYALAHEYAKLIGSPPGYVGHEEGGQLTESILKHPESVVLFDEIEKAHPRMHNLLLQILEEGALTDSKGRRVSFERTCVVLTSNAGASEMVDARRRVGFERTQTLGAARLHEIAIEALERQFTPEFLGRLDETLVFAELDVDAARAIAQRQLTELAARARKRGLRVAFTPAVARWVAVRGFSADYGARELRRVIQREVESPLSSFVLAHEGRSARMIRVRVQDVGVVFAYDH